jgi:nucleotide-binding universal stress UspA family protein
MLKRLLVPLDGSDSAEYVFPHVVTLARAFGSEIVLLHVMDPAQLGDPLHMVDPLQWSVDRTEATLYLNSIVARLQKVGLSVQPVILEGRAHERITEFAHRFDLTILCTQGRSGPSEWRVGSVTQKVLSRLGSSVLLIRAYPSAVRGMTESRYQRLLVPLDGSMRAESVLPMASALAQSCIAQLQIAHVVSQLEIPHRLPPTQAEREMLQKVTESSHQAAISYLEQLQYQLSVKPRIHVLNGENVANALQSLADREHTDLMILCAHGHTGDARRTYGNVTANLITDGNMPLLILQDIAVPPDPAPIVQPARQREIPRHALG